MWEMLAEIQISTWDPDLYLDVSYQKAQVSSTDLHVLHVCVYSGLDEALAGAFFLGGETQYTCVVGSRFSQI